MEQTDFSSATGDVLRRGDEVLYRLARGQGGRVLLVVPDLETAKSRKRLEHELALRTDLDASWASQPVALTRYGDRLALELQDPGGEPLACAARNRKRDACHALCIKIVRAVQA